MFALGDVQTAIQEATKQAASTAQVLLPPTIDALPEEQAWSMIYAEWGVVGIVGGIVVVSLWRMLSKFIAETRQQNADLMAAQASSIKMLSESVLKVEVAVKLADQANTHALTRLAENLGAVIVRLDKHEARLERHSDRIAVIEVEKKIEERSRRPSTLPG